MENTQVGPFMILKRLGTNRRQQVYHAKQIEQDKDVAIKFITLPPTVEWSMALDKIQREVAELQKLKHKNLVKVYGAGVEEDKVFFASELIDGESLSAILSRRGKLMPDLVVEIGIQVARLLDYLHRNELIHSKLTPDKIIVTADNKVKVSDVRLNRARKRRWDATGRRELDIAAYMAPEQYTEGATSKSDFYSLGVILFEMLTGKLPYEPDTMGRMTRNKMNAPVPSVATHIMNCPIWLDKIVTQMLNPTARERPHTAKAIVYALKEIKKIDTTKKSAVSQLTGTFNPLTAGEDKTEAKRLLGKKEDKQREPSAPFYQSVIFQVASLAVIIALLIWMAIPPSNQTLLTEAKADVNSRDPDRWRDAAVQLNKMMKLEDTELADEAEDYYFKCKRKILVQVAEDGITYPAQPENVRAFVEGVLAQLDGRKQEALSIFKRLVGKTSPSGDERHVYYESMARLQILAAEVDMPTDKTMVAEMVLATQTAESIDDLITAENLLERVAIEFAAKPDFQDVCLNAQENLIVVRQKIEAIKFAKENPGVEPNSKEDDFVDDSGDPQ